MGSRGADDTALAMWAQGWRRSAHELADVRRGREVDAREGGSVVGGGHGIMEAEVRQRIERRAEEERARSKNDISLLFSLLRSKK